MKSVDDDAVRVEIYRWFIRSGRAPSVAEAARSLDATTAEVTAAYRRLADAHVIVLLPNTTEIWMAAPFSAKPTPFLVTTEGRRYFGNCIWDALGIPAMLDADARTDTDCADCGEPMTLEVADGLLRAEGVAHFAVPAAHWWDDIGFT